MIKVNLEILNWDLFIRVRAWATRKEGKGLLFSPVAHLASCHRWIVLDSKSRNVPEVVIVRRGAVGVVGVWKGWDSWVKGGANGVSLQAT